MFQGIENWFGKLFGSVSKEEKVILSHVVPIAESDAKEIIAAALPLAVPIVESIFHAGSLKGTPARDAAVEQLKNQVVSQGIADAESIGTSTLNWVVETALKNVQLTTPAAAAAPPPATTT